MSLAWSMDCVAPIATTVAGVAGVAVMMDVLRVDDQGPASTPAGVTGLRLSIARS